MPRLPPELTPYLAPVHVALARRDTDTLRDRVRDAGLPKRTAMIGPFVRKLVQQHVRKLSSGAEVELKPVTGEPVDHVTVRIYKNDIAALRERYGETLGLGPAVRAIVRLALEKSG